MDHGQFMPWVEKRCGFSHATANGYMKIAEGWPILQRKIRELDAEKPKSQRVTNLSLRGALALLREKPRTWGSGASETKSAPRQVVHQFLADIDRFMAGIQRAAEMLDRLRPQADQIMSKLDALQERTTDLRKELTSRERAA
jgi:hypothetical protein